MGDIHPQALYPKLLTRKDISGEGRSGSSRFANAVQSSGSFTASAEAHWYVAHCPLRRINAVEKLQYRDLCELAIDLGVE